MVMKLRWYQEDAVASVFDYFRTKKGAPCVVLPTGSGKTPVIAELCRQVVEWGGRAIVLAHVKELLEQSREKLGLFLPSEAVGVYSAGLNERTTATPVIVAGIQSVYQRAEELGEFHLIVVDEAHLIPPEGCGRYRQFLDAEKTVSPKARLVGLTATPFRLGSGWITKDRAEKNDDGDRLLDEIVYEVSILDLISAGFLSPLVSQGTRAALDLTNVHTVRGDFDEGEVENLLGRRSILSPICHEIVEKTRDRQKVLIFCNRLASARKVAQSIKAQDAENDVVVVDGATPPRERDAIVRRFKGEKKADLFGAIEEKPLKYVCNVGVFTTGFDAPNVDCVALIRPTKSLALYQQMVGRGLRLAEGKQNCLVLDFGGNIDRHGPLDMPRPSDDEISSSKKPWRECPQCRSFVSYSYPDCPICGAKFPKGASDPDSNLTARSSSSSLFGEEAEPKIEEFDVTDVGFSAHYKKDDPSKPPTLQVEYFRGQFCRPVREWLCVEHENQFARRRFERWWKSKSKVEPPATTELAVEWATKGALAIPKRIKATTKPGTYFPEIEWLDATEIPDFDPAKIKSDFDEFFEGYDEFNSFDGTQEEPESKSVEGSGAADPRQETCLRCKDCGNWNDYGLDDFSGFCWAYNCEQNGKSAACSEYFKERFIDPDIPF